MSNLPYSKKRTFTIISLGCPKNLVDSEAMAGQLVEQGFIFEPVAEKVDLAILNTCGFLTSAREEARDCLRALLRLKKRRLVRFVVVTGCLIPVEGKKLAEEFPGVDVWLGPFDEHRLSKTVERLFSGDKLDGNGGSDVGKNIGDNSKKLFPNQRLTFDDQSRMLLTADHVAYLKIADGCDRCCSYCLIPSIRGRFVSKPQQVILDESKRLADQGVRELVLIAQETTFWGNDLDGSSRLADLLAMLKEQGDFDWIRLLYSYPQHWNDDLLRLFGFDKTSAGQTSFGKKSTVILPYIDLPLQHCNEGILRAMNRRGSKTEIEELLSRLRESIEGLVLRTSMIVGFPGETDAMFDELGDFLEKWKFERAGIFAYSPEQGTPAAVLPNQIPEKVRHLRRKRLYARQERITHQKGRATVGNIMDVLIDRQGTDDKDQPLTDLFIGRTYADSPDIDPLVYVTADGLLPGTFVSCEIVDVNGLDLIAVPASK